MYQIQTQPRVIINPVTICCELWKLLPIEQQEFQDEADNKIVEVSSDQPLTDKDLKSIIAEHFPDWHLGSWWNPEPNTEFEEF